MYCEFPLLGRCLFCLPLRQGVLAFGYLNVLFNLFLIYAYSALIARSETTLVYRGSIVVYVPFELCIALFCLDVAANVVLLYGTHRKHTLCLKIFYYFSVSTVLASLLVQIIECITSGSSRDIFEVGPFVFAGTCVQVYLIILVRSLLRKMQISEGNTFENQLHHIVSGDSRSVNNGMYDSTVIPINSHDV